MSVVLVVEPDSSQAEKLRRAVRGRLDAELLLVSTTAAAITAMDRAVPDLVLISALLSPRDEDALFAHMRSLDGASHLQTLTIPQLSKGKESAAKKVASLGGRLRKKPLAAGPAGCDPVLFVDQIRAYLARSREVQSSNAEIAATQAIDRHLAALEAAATAPVDEPVFYESVFTEQPRRIEQPASVERPRHIEAVVEIQEDVAAWQPAAEDSWIEVKSDPESERLENPLTVEEVQTQLAAEIERFEFHAQHERREADLLQAQADAQVRFTAEVERVQAEAEERRVHELARVQAQADIQRATAVNEARAAAEAEARRALAAERELRAQERREADLLQAQAEAEERRLHELARVQAQADIQRAAAVNESRVAAEAEARRALAAERELRAQERREADLLQAQADAQVRFTAEVERVQAEAEERRVRELARVQAEAEIQRATAVNEARAAAETEARSALAAELEQVRLDEIARVQAEADQRCDTVAKQVRAEAEAEAARTMMEELARVRAEVEQTLNARLERSRAEADELRKTEVARVQAESAALRTIAAEDARLAAEAAASRVLETQVARVRTEAEARLRAELDVIRAETEHLRRASQSEASQTVEKVREAAVRDTRAIAEAANHALEAELVRVREEADSRLEAELVKTRAYADQQRAAELEDIRTQVAQMREAASLQARTAAAQAIAQEVAAVAAERLPAPPPPPRPPREIAPIVEPLQAAASAHDYYSLWKPQAEPAAEPVEEPAPATDMQKSLMTLIRSTWALPVAAGLLLVVGNGISVGWSWRPRSAARTPASIVQPVERPAAHAEEITSKTGKLVIASDPPGARVLLDGAAAGQTPITVAKLKPGAHTVVLQTSAGTVTRKVTVQAGETARVSESIFSGWLAVFSRIPLNISIGGHLRGTTEDGQVMLSPGTYNVVLASERFNYREIKSLTIEPGKVASYTVSLPKGVLHIGAPDGTDVSIDGVPAGRTPLGNLPVPIGTHEVVGKHPEVGERRQSIEVKLGETAEAILR